MDLGITGRTALVLGASGGLGGAIAVRLAQEGVNVAAAGRSADALAATVSQVEAAGAEAVPLVWDLGDLDRMEPSVAEVERTLGPVDILVNNTGGPPPTPAAGQDIDTWRASFESMVLAVIALTDRVLARDEGTWLGPHPHVDVVGCAYSDPESRTLQHACAQACTHGPRRSPTRWGATA